ncbi:MAG: hypothetical protein ACLU4J_03820 [Butyricimonas paravirosa]
MNKYPKRFVATVESLHPDVVAAQSRYSAAIQRVKSAYGVYRQIPKNLMPE